MDCYLITFTTYGTWLAGDERGSFLKAGIYIKNDPILKKTQENLLKNPPVIFDSPRCNAVAEAIREVCFHRQWNLHALNVRSNHVHAVISSTVDVDKVISDFKSYATRRLRSEGLVGKEEKIWTAKGNSRILRSEKAYDAAVHYVNECQ